MLQRRAVLLASLLGLLFLPLGCDDEPAEKPTNREQSDYLVTIARERAEVDAAKAARIATTAPAGVAVPRPVSTAPDVPPPAVTPAPSPSPAAAPAPSPSPEAAPPPAPAVTP
ncbi:MAG: hypothetical protein PHU85_02410 [Phycisphaerae bacterium]|nr:hypothetical protein [Phycisphaerae bacterium]